jgi:hypothetical protein
MTIAVWHSPSRGGTSVKHPLFLRTFSHLLVAVMCSCRLLMWEAIVRAYGSRSRPRRSRPGA